MPIKIISECKHDVQAEAEAKAHINQVPAVPNPHNFCTGRSYDNRAAFDSDRMLAYVHALRNRKEARLVLGTISKLKTQHLSRSHQQLQSGEDQRPWRVLCWAQSPHLSPLKLSTWAPCGTVGVVWSNVQWPASDSPLSKIAICCVTLQLVSLVMNKRAWLFKS